MIEPTQTQAASRRAVTSSTICCCEIERLERELSQALAAADVEAREADRLRADLINDLREVFYSASAETPQAVRDVIEYADSWLSVYVQRRFDQSTAAQPLVGWLRAIDEALVASHIGVANSSDSYDEAKQKLNALLAWTQAVAVDPAVNGGVRLVSAQQPAPREPLTEGQIVSCLQESSCVGTVKMSYESGPYDIDRPSINATRLVESIERAHGITAKKEHSND